MLSRLLLSHYLILGVGRSASIFEINNSDMSLGFECPLSIVIDSSYFFDMHAHLSLLCRITLNMKEKNASSRYDTLKIPQ